MRSRLLYHETISEKGVVTDALDVKSLQSLTSDMCIACCCFRSDVLSQATYACGRVGTLDEPPVMGVILPPKNSAGLPL